MFLKLISKKYFKNEYFMYISGNTTGISVTYQFRNILPFK